MIRLVTAAEMRRVEQAEFARGVSEDELSDRAAAAVARWLQDLVAPAGSRDIQGVVVLAGPGNNGLDGVKIHRLLASAGLESRLHCWRRSDCASAWDLGGFRRDLVRARVVVDALFGIGLARPLEGEAAGIVEAVAEERARRARDAPPLTVVSVDVPSGLQADTGRAMGVAVTADMTITLGLPKVGLYTGDGPRLAGRIRRESIGLDADTLQAAGAVGFTSQEPIHIPAREIGSHKNDNGRVLVIGGSLRYPGAPTLAALGAQRAGAGYVTVGFPRSMLVAIAPHLLEQTLLPLPESEVGTLGPPSVGDAAEAAAGYKALVLGNGIGREEDTQTFLLTLLGVSTPAQRRAVGFRRPGADEHQAGERVELPPTVVDGDGLHALASRDGWWENASSVAMLTPHPGEMAALVGRTVDDVEADRLQVARDAAGRWGKTVLLKGAYPLVASPEGGIWVFTEAHPEQGTAGSGDVLAGVCGFLLAVGFAPADAARAALVLGARASALAAERVGPDSVSASDLLSTLSEARRQDGQG